MSRWDERLKCNIISINLFSDTIVQLILPERNCTDMSGAIKVASLVNPDVTKIEVYVEDDIVQLIYDIVYTKAKPWSSSGKWTSQRMSKTFC